MDEPLLLVVRGRFGTEELCSSCPSVGVAGVATGAGDDLSEDPPPRISRVPVDGRSPGPSVHLKRPMRCCGPLPLAASGGEKNFGRPGEEVELAERERDLARATGSMISS